MKNTCLANRRPRSAILISHYINKYNYYLFDVDVGDS